MNRLATTAAATALALAPALALARDYDVTGFTRIQAAAGVKVTVQTGRDFHVEGEAIRGNIRRLRIVKRGGTLSIGRRHGWGLLSWFRSDRFEVTVAMPDLDAVHASSGSTVIVAAGEAADFTADASSGASLAIEGLRAKDVDLEASSGSTLRIAGTCEKVKAQASSGASLSAKDLRCNAGRADASSGADLSVFTSQKISAEASSGASVSVHGDPADRDTDASSGGSVSLR